MHGRIGTRQVNLISFAVPEGVPERSLDFWERFLGEHNIDCKPGYSSFGQPVLSFADPDGLRLELVSTPHSNPDRIWKHSLVPPEFAICGFHHVTLSRRRDTKEPRLF